MPLTSFCIVRISYEEFGMASNCPVWNWVAYKAPIFEQSLGDSSFPEMISAEDTGGITSRLSEAFRILLGLLGTFASSYVPPYHISVQIK